MLFFPLIVDSKILNRKTKEDLIIGIIIQEVVVILEVLNLGQGTMMIGDQNLFQKKIVSNVMMIINLMKKKLIERVEVAVKVAKILIEKQKKIIKNPKCNCDFFPSNFALGNQQQQKRAILDEVQIMDKLVLEKCFH